MTVRSYPHVTQMTAGNKLSRKENAVPDFNEPDAEEIETIKKLRVSNSLHLNRVGIQVLKYLATSLLGGVDHLTKKARVCHPPPSTHLPDITHVTRCIAGNAVK